MSQRDAWRELPPGPQRLFFEKVNELWWEREAPSGRKIAEALQERKVRITQGTVNNLLNGPRMPFWDTVALVVVRYLGGDRQAFLALWRDAKQAQNAAAEYTQSETPSTFVFPDLSEAGSFFELRSLLRSSRSGSNHRSLLIDETGRQLSYQESLALVNGITDELPFAEDRLLARALFGLDPHTRDMTLTERRTWAGNELKRTTRTVRRREQSLVDQMAEILAARLAMPPAAGGAA